MSYKDKRKEIFLESEIDDFTLVFDSVWLKMRELAYVYNESVKMGIPNHLEPLKKELFTNDAIKSILDIMYPKPKQLTFVYINGNRETIEETHDSQPQLFPEKFQTLEIDYKYFFETIPKTRGELYDYFYRYQEIACYLFEDMEKYHDVNGLIVNISESSPVTNEEPPYVVSKPKKSLPIADAGIVKKGELEVLQTDKMKPMSELMEELKEREIEENKRELEELNLTEEDIRPPSASVSRLLPDRTTDNRFYENTVENEEIKKEYDRRCRIARDYVRDLFPLYAKSLIEYMGKSWKVIANEYPYRKAEEEINKSKIRDGTFGRHDFMTMKDGLFLFLNRELYGCMTADNYSKDKNKKFFDEGYIRLNYGKTKLADFISEGYHNEIFHDMIFESVTDLLPYEDNWSIDGTGMSTSCRGLYHDDVHKKQKEPINFCYAVALVTTRTDVILFANTYFKKESSEINEFNNIIIEMQERGVKPKSICADALYGTRELHNKMGELGIEYYTDFSSTITEPPESDTSQFAIDYRFKTEHPVEYKKRYHRRSNSESVFSALKERCDENIRSRNRNGGFGEVLAKCVTYNICRMIQQLFINGIVPHYVSQNAVYDELQNILSNEEKRKWENKIATAEITEKLKKNEK